MSAAPTPLPQIVLTDEQLAVLRTANAGPIELRTSAGQRVAIANLVEDKLYPFTTEDVAIAQARSAKKRAGLNLDQVMQRLQTLDK